MNPDGTAYLPYWVGTTSLQTFRHVRKIKPFLYPMGADELKYSLRVMEKVELLTAPVLLD